MGPPLKAAENVAFVVRHVIVASIASMGPPLKAAENLKRCRRGIPRRLQRFNGAAAKSSGKLDELAKSMPKLAASMGPPLKAAENRLAH